MDNIFFLDIETVPQSPNFDSLDQLWKDLWEKKSKTTRLKEELTLEESYSSAGLYPEFGKIVCISVGYIQDNHGEKSMTVTTFQGEERPLLQVLAAVLQKHSNWHLCGHNGKTFDFPFISKRMVVHQLDLPPQLRTQGMKPWEVPHLDTMEMWKFGSRYSSSLDLLCAVFGIPSPKGDIDGSQVGSVYYQGEIDRIVHYCEKDVVALIQLYLAMRNEPLIDEVNIKITDR